MKFRIRYAEQIVGLFVIIAFVSLAGILIFMGINQRWFKKDYAFVSRFESGEGLTRGMAIKLKGFKIGAVDTVVLSPDNSVAIDFHVFDTYYNRVRRFSVIELTTSPIGIGGGGLTFHPGKPGGELLPEGAYIPSLDFEEGRRLVARGLVEMPQKADAASDIIDRIGPMLDSTHDTIKSVNSILRTVDGTLKGTDKGPLARMLRETETLLQQVNVTLAQMTDEISPVIANTAGITANIEKTTAELTETQGLVAKLLGDEGSVGMLFNDEELYNSITSIVAELEVIAAEFSSLSVYINEQKPQISTLIEKGKSAIDEGENVLEGLSNNPLLRKGITEDYPTPSTFQGYRDEEF
jgi:phospholipid/cholesterol/gamma-HCH transport system substrate-binding protein